MELRLFGCRAALGLCATAAAVIDLNSESAIPIAVCKGTARDIDESVLLRLSVSSATCVIVVEQGVGCTQHVR